VTNRLWLVLAILALVVPSLTAQNRHAFIWTSSTGMTDVGTLGGNFSEALAINASGQVVGYSDIAGDATFHAFLWTSAGGMQDLGTLDGTLSAAQSINASGEVVGYSTLSDNDRSHFHAFLWTASAGMKDLGTLGGKSSSGNAINDSGQVTGGASLAQHASHAFIWTAASGMKDLGALGGSLQGGSGSSGFGINSSGEVVGVSTTNPVIGSNDDPFSWTITAGMKNLYPTLDGGTAYAINNSGNIAGWVNSAATSTAALWKIGTHTPSLLPTLGGTVAIAVGINSHNVVVGRSTTTSGVTHAFLWTQSAGITDLGTLGGSNSEAYSINSAGQVVGDSEVP
jgi:probable HAF family extracellular repeat protein